MNDNANPFDAGDRSREEQLRNVARCVLRHTEIVREHDGRGRHRTYAADLDTIAEAARLLAELVLGGQIPNGPAKRAGKATPSRRPLSHD